MFPVCAAALPLQSPSQPSVNTQIDPDQLKNLVQEMIANLNNFDPTAGELFNAHRDAFQSFFTPETFKTFEKQMSSFAFADALTVLQQVAKQKGVQL